MTMEISEKFIEIVSSSFTIWNITKSAIEKEVALTKTQYKMIKLTEARADRLFKHEINSNDTKSDDFVALAQAYLYMSYIRIHQVKKESLFIANIYLTRCTKLIREKELDPKVIVVAVKVFNNLANVYIKLSKSDEALRFYEKSLQLLEAYTKGKDEYPIPLNVVYHCGIIVEISDKDNLDELHTFTLIRLIDLTSNTCTTNKSWESNNQKFILYKHKMLSEQLKKILVAGYVDWAIESAELSKYFLLHSRFTEARHHLAAASLILKKFHEEKYLKIDQNDSERDSISDQYYNGIAKVAISWAIYGITLLHSSTDRFFPNNEADKYCETTDLKSEIETKSEKQSTELLMFANIENDLKEFAVLFTDKHIFNCADAKTTFINILKCLNEALIYYTPEKSAKIYIQIIRYISKAYKYLASYELNKDEQLKLHKRRAEILEKVLTTCQLNAKNDINIYKHIQFDIAVTYNTILNIQTEQYELGDEISASESSNLDNMKNLSISNFQSYLGSE